MRVLRPFLLFLAACCAGPAVAAPARAGSAREDPGAVIESEMAAYGQWLARLQEIEAPVQGALANLSPAWQAAQAGGGTPGAIAGRFRPVVAGTLAALDAANAGIEALDRPEYPALDLPADVSPAAMVREVQTLNRRIRTAIEAFNPLLDAAATNDSAAAAAAGGRLLASFGLILESQVVLARAGLAATPRDDPSWQLSNLDLLFSRIGARAFASFEPSGPRVDAALPDDLLALASELDASAEEGVRTVTAELESYAEALVQAERQGNRSDAVVLRRAIAVFTAGQASFPLARELAALLRAEAARMRGLPTTVETTRRFFQQMRPIRMRMDEIGRQAIAGLASPQ